MKRGIDLLNQSEPSAIHEALACFDAALEIRSTLPIQQEPWLRYCLAACWLNRADALVRLGGAQGISAALASYDAGIEVLRPLDLGSDARFPRRLAIALQNRALALQKQGEASMTEAIRDFNAAMATLDTEVALLIPDRQYLRATVWMNLANAYLAESRADARERARNAALRALSLAGDLEENDAAAAEVGLKARHVLCRTLILTTPDRSAERVHVPEDVHQATDAADSGLALVQAWEHRGVTRFRDIAYDLFRFGARVYALFQPQFLREFVRDNLDPEKSSSDYVRDELLCNAAKEAMELIARPTGVPNCDTPT